MNEIKEIMRSHGIEFKKKFGQNFIVNETIPKQIAEIVRGEECVIEIGPGIGTLTRELCEVCTRVTAVEIDGELIPILHETLAGYNNVDIIHGDFMKYEIKETNFAVAANLPYYITTDVIEKLMKYKPKANKIVLMLQKEAANRLCGEPGEVMMRLAYYGKTEKKFDVSAGNFIPQPKVDSTVICITPHNDYSYVNEKILFRVLKNAFAQRRKTLANALAAEFDKALVLKILDQCGIDSAVRGEKLSIREFVTVADTIYKNINKM
ncbi:MAG: 16S rRNA (adenine(1518)-N(6)/adenine(1519)-N(6))-dimethyltransferase RsmA [Oscillospiraceae bacterium]|nr:16S rRNA (adenine(1518)-N(6)/adenine(1519)-N(6))-dimethyltransferase RsmA [Oscillospiraceae bacterium]